ncbi:glycosyltransferase family 4 protein [Brachymonas denitrificans]|uniref:glycosyltransferase family 4 protein n=1 Tax=Brachymonas denitrificans TaxID=28220 RepID=UPI00321FC21F
MSDHSLRLALVADTFPPLRTSGAVQLRDLSKEFARQGHNLTVILPAAELATSWQLESMEEFQILRLKAPQTKDISYAKRTVGEFLMPFAMRHHFLKSPLAHESWDGVVWYAPSIFHGPFIKLLKSRSSCKGYLIIRDIFPQWAVDMGLMGRGLPYLFFNAVARYQYSVADIIGVQTPGNLTYFREWQAAPGKRLEVLHNWLDDPAHLRCPVRVESTTLAGRKIFVYAGNMGVAQGMDILLELAENLVNRKDIGFIFVGRGSDALRLRQIAAERKLDNVLFFDEIHPDEIPDLYSQCSAGIVALDHRHKSHNIPGKFLTYMQSGLPVIANVNAGNDLAQIIREEKVGQVCETNSSADLLRLTEILLAQIEADDGLPERCKNLFTREFSAEKAVKQITKALISKGPMSRPILFSTE